MRKLLTDILCVAFVVCLVACSDGDDDAGGYIPPYITDFLVASTDADGKVVSVRLDDGTTYNVASQQVDLERKDTLLRCMATYTQEKGKDFKLCSIQSVYSNKPRKATSLYVAIDGKLYQDVSLLPREPMKVISMWKSGGYLNLHLGLMTTDQGVHQYVFCEDSVGHYSLLHLRPAYDGTAYTEHVYLSMPIPEGLDHFTFTVRTYDGDYTREF
ncbi:MAG: hypothetical protein J5616_00505 [Bacteroidaceae bacterium]|nr:hypothetical protein [Bacteroidaceae bacterium]